MTACQAAISCPDSFASLRRSWKAELIVVRSGQRKSRPAACLMLRTLPGCCSATGCPAIERCHALLLEETLVLCWTEGAATTGGFAALVRPLLDLPHQGTALPAADDFVRCRRLSCRHGCVAARRALPCPSLSWRRRAAAVVGSCCSTTPAEHTATMWVPRDRRSLQLRHTEFHCMAPLTGEACAA